MRNENLNEAVNLALNKADVMTMLPDGILWKNAKEYAKQFAIRDKPVESEKLMSEAQDHYYRGMIEVRRMLVGN